MKAAPVGGTRPSGQAPPSGTRSTCYLALVGEPNLRQWNQIGDWLRYVDALRNWWLVSEHRRLRSTPPDVQGRRVSV